MGKEINEEESKVATNPLYQGTRGATATNPLYQGTRGASSSTAGNSEEEGENQSNEEGANTEE